MAVYQKPKKRSALDDLATIFGIALPAVQTFMGNKQAQAGLEARAAEAAAGRAHDIDLLNKEIAAGRESDDTRFLGKMREEGYEMDPKLARGYQPAQRPWFKPTSTDGGPLGQIGGGLRIGDRHSKPEVIPDLSGMRPQEQFAQGAWNKPDEPTEIEQLQALNAHLQGMGAPYEGAVFNPSMSRWETDPNFMSEDARRAFEAELAYKNMQTSVTGRELETATAATQTEVDWDTYWHRYNEHERNVEPRLDWMAGNAGGSYEQHLADRQAEFFNLAGQPPGVPERMKAAVMQFVGELMLGDEDDYQMYLQLEDGPHKWAIDEQLQLNNFNPHEKFSGVADGGGGGIYDSGSADILSGLTNLPQQQGEEARWAHAEWAELTPKIQQLYRAAQVAGEWTPEAKTLYDDMLVRQQELRRILGKAPGISDWQKYIGQWQPGATPPWESGN